MALVTGWRARLPLVRCFCCCVGLFCCYFGSFCCYFGTMSKSKRSYKNCCAAGCVNTTMTSYLTFFSLPCDQNRRNEWLKLLRREDIEGKSSTHHRVCENHFDEDSIILTPTRKVLKKNAMPNRMLPIRKEDAPKIKDMVSSLTELCSHCQGCPNSLLPQTSSDQPDKKLRKTKHPEHMVFAELCDRFLSKNLSTIVKEQINIQSAINRGNIFYHGLQRDKIYSPDYMTFCQKLYHTSPEAYGLLRDTLCLPTKTYIEHMFLPITKQVNYMIEALKPLVARMTDREKNCALIVGAVRLKANLFYVAEEDTVCGFHEFEECQTNELAQYGVVAAVQGIIGNYQQLVGYALLPATKNEERVFKWIDKLIRQLWTVGLNVRVLISDTTYNFLDSANGRRVSIEKPYFLVDNRQIYYMFDPSHLMILMRDTLMSYDVYFDEDTVAAWDDIRKFYGKDAARKLRIAPKLTESHINPSDSDKTQAKLAVEMFCATVPAAISDYADLGGIDQNVHGTVKLLTKMNDIAKFFNLSSRYNIEYRNDFGDEIYDLYFLNSTLDFFAEFQVMDKNNSADVTLLLTCVHSFQITLKSLLILYNYLKIHGKTNILSRRLNKDILDKFFDDVKKTTNSTEPTSWQIVTELRKHYSAGFFKSSELAGDSIANVSNGMPSSLDLDGRKSPDAKKRKTNTATVTSAEARESSSSQQLNLHTVKLATDEQANNDIYSVIKQEPDTITFDFEEKSYTVEIKQEVIDPTSSPGDEDEHGDFTVQIKQEKEDFLAMDIEIEENELRLPFSKDTGNDRKFPTRDSTLEQDRNVTLSYSMEQVPEGTVKNKREDKDDVEIAIKTENSYPSLLITQDQKDMMTMVHLTESKRNRFLYPVLSENVNDIDFSSLYLPENKVLLNICGHLLVKTMTLHSDCNDFKTYALATPDEMRCSRYNDYVKNGGTKLLVAPPDDFVEHIEILDKIFSGFFKTRQTSNNTVSTVLHSLLKNCKNVRFLKPCECFPDKYTKVLFYRIRMHFTLEHNNRIYGERREQPLFTIPSL